MRHVTVLSRRWFPLTLQRTKFLQIRGWREKFSFHTTHGHGFAFCPEKVARYFQKALYYTTDIFLPFFKYRRRKNVPAFEKQGHHDLRILRFERIASTSGVRTHRKNERFCLAPELLLLLLGNPHTPFMSELKILPELFRKPLLLFALTIIIIL